jgi:hypothetical protein
VSSKSAFTRDADDRQSWRYRVNTQSPCACLTHSRSAIISARTPFPDTCWPVLRVLLQLYNMRYCDHLCRSDALSFALDNRVVQGGKKKHTKRYRRQPTLKMRPDHLVVRNLLENAKRQKYNDASVDRTLYLQIIV